MQQNVQQEQRLQKQQHQQLPKLLGKEEMVQSFGIMSKKDFYADAFRFIQDKEEEMAYFGAGRPAKRPASIRAQ